MFDQEVRLKTLLADLLFSEKQSLCSYRESRVRRNQFEHGMDSQPSPRLWSCLSPTNKQSRPDLTDAQFDLSGVSEFTTLSIRDSDHTGSRDSLASRRHRTMSNPRLPGQHPHQPLVLSPPPMRRDVVGRTGMLGPDEFVLEDSPPSPSLYISHGKATRNKDAAGTVGRKAVGKHGKTKRSKHAADSRLIATVIIYPEAITTTSELESWYLVTMVERNSTPTTGSRHKLLMPPKVVNYAEEKDTTFPMGFVRLYSYVPKLDTDVLPYFNII
ncbi:hypothetical protein CRM22_006485 [Opisthorchis felineus]|uniref:Uncharacterized protein n=1 Tax=Opisthorchis felineus TaxID=147828 RepID=A0A4S2LKN5_OPIFE|nr:hypothetical protein CRM22_006485 [Opisthorchis felineus]